jgi:hypothetical protein
MIWTCHYKSWLGNWLTKAAVVILIKRQKVTWKDTLFCFTLQNMTSRWLSIIYILAV